MKDKLDKKRHVIDYESAIRDYCLRSDYFSSRWNGYVIKHKYSRGKVGKRRIRSTRRLARYFFLSLGIELKNTKYDLTWLHDNEVYQKEHGLL